MISQYQELDIIYHQTLEETGKIEDAEQKTLETYLDFESKNQWLCVKNIWRNDSKVNSIPSYQDLLNVAQKNKTPKQQFSRQYLLLSLYAFTLNKITSPAE